MRKFVPALAFIGLAGLGAWLISFWLIEPARINFDLPSPDGKATLRWSCTQTGSAAEAEMRAKQAHDTLNAALVDAVKRTSGELKQALDAQETQEMATQRLTAIDNQVKEELQELAKQLEASHGCRPALF